MQSYFAIIIAIAAIPAVSGQMLVGNQIRDGGTHYNVAWTFGDPCIHNVAIAPESEDLCLRNFSIDGTEYYLAGCTNPDEGHIQDPQRLRVAADDSLAGICRPTDRIENPCTDDTHNVITRYICE